MSRTAILCSMLVLLVSPALAAPEIKGATNAASFLPAALPNGGLAQGSLVTLFGNDLGPDPFVQVTQFPLETALAGVSAKITAGGQTFDAIPIVVWTKQTTILIPSNVPAGNAEVQLTYNNQTSNSFPIRIVSNAFGIFALNQAGSGPGIFTKAVIDTSDPNWQQKWINTLTTSSSPGELYDIWGTGLGPVSGDEASGPLPGDLRGQINVQVIVGGRQAEVVYAGRSGCCAGIDQIRFVVPNITGCYVPVVVIVNGVPSNSVTMSIDSSGGACSVPGVMTSQDLEEAKQKGAIAEGWIGISRMAIQAPMQVPGAPAEMITESGSATFERYTYSQLIAVQPTQGIVTKDSCYVFVSSQKEDENEPPSSDPSDVDPVKPQTYLDAGPSININGPNGQRQLTPVQGQKGIYTAVLGNNFPFPIPGQPQGLYLDPGQYTIDNGQGGADVGPFDTSLNITNPAAWTNQDAINNVPGGQPLRITWTGVPNGNVIISGSSIDDPNDVMGMFFCLADGAAGQFDVPAWVIDSLPASSVQEGIPMGFLGLFTAMDPKRFEATGLDAGFVSWSSITMKNVSYRNPAPQ